MFPISAAVQAPDLIEALVYTFGTSAMYSFILQGGQSAVLNIFLNC